MKKNLDLQVLDIDLRGGSRWGFPTRGIANPSEGGGGGGGR